ncbi:hypothetical protein M404DRAFT_997749 [Pisolithus tinctorius Marx 270]|uniref:Uncharacterized protein n=1 Tax=Pisolithus tinctorius Marx 270 TaxID=870435 RepID=A0A0C3P3F8_PISTI|nr:hypothetical protein M404DRAFT_997749 [Pisolithus tinctorius Marx 270]
MRAPCSHLVTHSYVCDADDISVATFPGLVFSLHNLTTSAPSSDSQAFDVSPM